MATTNKDFVVKAGVKVATGVTFPDGSVQTTAYTGSISNIVVPPLANPPASPTNGQLYFDTNALRPYYYWNGTWYAMASYDDTYVLVEHTHDTAIDGDGYILDTFPYNTNVAEQPALQTTAIDGGSPSTTSFTSVIDGGEL